MAKRNWFRHQLTRGIAGGKKGLDASKTLHQRPLTATVILIGVLSICLFPFLGSAPKAEPIAVAPIEDTPSTLATAPQIDGELATARTHARSGRIGRALLAYRDVANTAPAALEDRDIRTIARYLGRRNKNTHAAEKILMVVGARAKPTLRTIWKRSTKNRYLQRRAGEVLINMLENECRPSVLAAAK